MSIDRQSPPAGHHELARFECRSPEQTEWLRRYARQSVGTGTTRVFVVTGRDSPVVALPESSARCSQLDFGSSLWVAKKLSAA
jgi:hypothetical protein